MKLLFDHNLPPQLAVELRRFFPESAHVAQKNLATANDDTVWEYAKKHGYSIMTKDSDFSVLSVIKGFPPKIIWLRCGNATTSHIRSILEAHSREVSNFLMNIEGAYLELPGI